MNITAVVKYIIVGILIGINLVLPTTILACSPIMETDVSSVRTVCSAPPSFSCDGCPCSDENGSSCCDSAFCCCACHAPLSQYHRLTYAPVIITQDFIEPLRVLPQVCRPIFVPPQNIA